MNISETQQLFSATNKQISDSIDLFYIGTFIGLAGGFLCACIIAHYKYRKKKMALASLPIEVVL
jgi:hypothetical protein